MIATPPPTDTISTWLRPGTAEAYCCARCCLHCTTHNVDQPSADRMGRDRAARCAQAPNAVNTPTLLKIFPHCSDDAAAAAAEPGWWLARELQAAAGAAGNTHCRRRSSCRSLLFLELAQSPVVPVEAAFRDLRCQPHVSIYKATCA